MASPNTNSQTVTVTETEGNATDKRVWRILQGVQSPDHFMVYVAMGTQQPKEIRLYPETFIPNPDKLAKALEQQGIDSAMLKVMGEANPQAAQKLKEMALQLFKGNAVLPAHLHELPADYIAFRHERDWQPTIHIGDATKGMPVKQFTSWGEVMSTILSKHDEVDSADVLTVLVALGAVQATPKKLTVNNAETLVYELKRIRDNEEAFKPYREKLMRAYGMKPVTVTSEAAETASK